MNTEALGRKSKTSEKPAAADKPVRVAIISPSGSKIDGLVHELDKSECCMRITPKSSISGLKGLLADGGSPIVIAAGGRSTIKATQILEAVRKESPLSPLIFITEKPDKKFSMKLLGDGAYEVISQAEAWRLPYIVQRARHHQRFAQTTDPAGWLAKKERKKPGEIQKRHSIEQAKKSANKTPNIEGLHPEKQMQRLEQKCSRLDAILENTRAHLAYLDVDFNFLMVNSAYCEGSGYAREELIGRNHFELFPNPENQAIFEKASISGDPVEFHAKPFEFPEHPEWGVTYWDWTLVPQKDATGKVRGFVFSLVDVTETKRSEEKVHNAFKLSERRQAEIAALLEGSRAVLSSKEFLISARAIFDTCKKLLGAKAGYFTLLKEEGNYSDIVILDSGGADCTADGTLPIPVRGLRQVVVESGKPVFENNFSESKWSSLVPPGHMVLENVLFAPLLVQGKAVGLLGLANKSGGFTSGDCEMVNAFAELGAIAYHNWQIISLLQNSEERFRSVAETANDAIITIDVRGQIVFWNSAAEKIFGYPRKEIMGKQLAAIIPEKYRERHTESIAGFLRTEVLNSPERVKEFHGLRKDGSQFPLELSVSTWHMGQDIFFTGIARDVSESKQMEQALRRSRDELEARVMERTEKLVNSNISLQLEMLERERAEQALRRSEKRYRILFEQNVAGVFRTMLDGVILDCNAAFASLIGFQEAGEIQGKRIETLFKQPPGQPAFMTELEETGFIRNFEICHIRGDGSMVWLILNLIKIQEEEEGHFILLGMVINITHRKMAEEKLAIERQRMFSLLDELPASVLLIDRDHIIRFANRQLHDRFGYVDNSFCYKVLKNRGKPCNICPIRRVIDQGESIEWEEMYADGRMYHTFHYPFYDIDGSVLLLQLGIDITERKLAEEGLRSSEERFHLLVDSIDDIVFTLDKQERFAEVYGHWFEKQGMSAKDFVGKKVGELLDAESARAFRRANRRVLRGENVVFEWTNKNLPEQIWIQVSLSPIYSAGVVDGVVGVGRDVTRQKLFEKQLIQTEKLLAIGQMSAIISHEFRNSLTSVKMILELQLESMAISEDDKISLKVALDSVAHLEDIVHQLLHFSRPKAMKFELQNLNDVVDASISFMKIQMRKEKVELQKKLDSHVPLMYLDGEHLKEALINILVNAVQALARDDIPVHSRKIEVFTRKLAIGREFHEFAFKNGFEKRRKRRRNGEELEIIMPAGTKCVLIEIADNGPGISEEVLEHIFDLFYTTKSGGTGLGLPMVKRTVNNHGGVVQVKSKPGRGTKFFIFLPLRKR